MSVVLLGANGFVGRHLWPALEAAHPGSLSYTRAEYDLRSGERLLLPPDCRAVVVAAATTDTRRCEDAPDETHTVNVAAPAALARQLAGTGVKLVTFSSDYVFDGLKPPYADTAMPSPTIVYGRQKAELESCLPGITDNCLILRLSRLYGTTKGEGAFLDAIARSIDAGQCRAATDQAFCPTYIGDVVRALLTLLADDQRGLFNLCAPRRWSRYDLAVRLAEASGRDPNTIEAMQLADLPGFSTWPRDTTMQCSSITARAAGSFLSVDQALSAIPHAGLLP
ncbi:MAG: dTDP-4-dehydrorhamnose reductase [Rhodothermales bacterium]|jgi:dTDP-4-dehydrorhamnose reductase